MGTQSEKTTIAPQNPQNKKKIEDGKMCHPSQSSPNQNQAWQGVYPDLSAFNDLFSQAPPPNPQSSPWIAFLGSLGLQPIPQEQPSAPPAPEQDTAGTGQTFAGSNVNSQPPQAGNQGSNTQSPPDAQGCHQGSNHSRSSTQSCGYSCAYPHISQLFKAVIPRLLHFSSVVTRASITFFCAIAFFCILSSLPGFLIHSALYLVLATSLLGLPLPALLAGHVIYSVVTFLHPLCALVLLLPCLHRLHMRGLPLANPANWRFAGANTAWTHYHHQNQQ